MKCLPHITWNAPTYPKESAQVKHNSTVLTIDSCVERLIPKGWTEKAVVEPIAAARRMNVRAIMIILCVILYLIEKKEKMINNGGTLILWHKKESSKKFCCSVSKQTQLSYCSVDEEQVVMSGEVDPRRLSSCIDGAG